MTTSTARTRVGIVVWASRASCARTLEMRLADTMGSWVTAARDPAAKVVLARHARHHAFHASLWDSVVPLLHDVRLVDDPVGEPLLADVVAALATEGPSPDPVRRMFDVALPALVGVYRSWAADTGVIADRPVMRVLDLVLRDEEFDLREGRGHEGLLAL